MRGFNPWTTEVRGGLRRSRRQFDRGGLLPSAGLADDVQLWEWTGDNAATSFSYWTASGFIMIATFWQDSMQQGEPRRRHLQACVTSSASLALLR